MPKVRILPTAEAFRAEKPQRGRYREFLQCDADIFGTISPVADAEVIALSLDIYRQLGFNSAQVRINDRSLLSGIPYPAIVAIDKLAKIGRDGVIMEMTNKGFSKAEAQKYFDIVASIKPNSTIQTIFAYLKALGFNKDWYIFDPTIARSFSYSTGPIWEVFIPNSAGSVLGGERFDQLTEKIAGINIPGTGFGLGFDRTLEVMEEYQLLPSQTQTIQVLVSIFSSETVPQSVQLADQLRQSGINTSIYSDSTAKLAKQIKYADKLGINFVAILGDEEIANGTVTIKNLHTTEQKTISAGQAIELIKS